MKKFIYLIFLLSPFCYFGQDTLRYTNSEFKLVKVEEIGLTEIKFRRFENLDGPLYVAQKSEVAYIRYVNGQVDKFGTVGSAPATSVNSTEPPKDGSFVNYNPGDVKKFIIKKRDLIYDGKKVNDKKLFNVLNLRKEDSTKTRLLAEHKTMMTYKRGQKTAAFCSIGTGVLIFFAGASMTSIDMPYAGSNGLLLGLSVGTSGFIVQNMLKKKRNKKKMEIALLHNQTIN